MEIMGIFLILVVISLFVILIFKKRNIKIKLNNKNQVSDTSRNGKNGTKQQAILRIRSRLDQAIISAVDVVTNDLYDNVIINTLKQWFESNDSVSKLNEDIKKNIKSRWPFLSRKIINIFREFEEFTTIQLSEMPDNEGTSINAEALSEKISESISFVIGLISTTLLSMLLGGGGTALLASGPIGIVVGIVIGVIGMFIGKSKIERLLGRFLIKRKIPSMLKKGAKGKLVAELRLNKTKFQDEVNKVLEKLIEPIYQSLDSMKERN